MDKEDELKINESLLASVDPNLSPNPNSLSAHVIRSHSFQNRAITIVKVEGEVKPYLPDDAVPQ